MTAHQIAVPIPDDVPRTLEQIAEALGEPYTVNTLRAAVERGDLVTYRVVGKAYFTDRRYVQDWIERCRARQSDPGGDDGGDDGAEDGARRCDPAEAAAVRLIRGKSSPARPGGTKRQGLRSVP